MATIRYRRKITPEDVELIIEYWSRHPEEREIHRLQQNILAAHPCNLGIIVENSENGQILAVGEAIFVRDEFFEYCRSSEKPWVLDHLCTWLESGRQPLLDADEIKVANSTSGLTMLVTTYGIWPSPEFSRATLFRYLVGKHVETYEGYNLKRCFLEPAEEPWIPQVLRQGYQIVNNYEIVVRESSSPLLMVIEREDALESHDYYITRLFAFNRPRCGFSESQQELLIEARFGGTDDEISERLFVTRDTIKKRWAGIYQKLEAAFPDLLPEASEGQRSRERRRLAILFARDNPWELRPYDKRLASRYRSS